MSADLEQVAAWLQAPYNRQALMLVCAAAAVLALALTAGVFAAVANWGLRRRARRAAAAPPPPPAASADPPAPAPTSAAQSPTPQSPPKAAYEAILRLIPQDERARRRLDDAPP